jgi:hypothetical protein
MRLRAVTLAAISGCSDNSTRPEDCAHFNDQPVGITSPEAALLALKEAYREREFAVMDSLLSPDFVFELSPENAGQPGVPAEWGRGSELAICTLLFDADLVQTLALDFVIGSRVFDEAEQLLTITITNVDLSLYGTTPGHPTPKAYLVQDSTSRFWFRPMTWNAHGTDEPAWKIVKWQDESIEGAQRRGLQSPPGSGSNTTWGYIKSLYLPQPQ